MTYRSPATGLPVRAVLFDVFGTVVDWRSGIAAAVRIFADGHGLELDPGAFGPGQRGRDRGDQAGLRVTGPLSNGNTSLLRRSRN